MAEESQRSSFWQAVALAWQLGYTITVPIVLFALGGRFLDRRFGTEPWLLLTGILVSIVISSIGITMRVRRIIQ